MNEFLQKLINSDSKKCDFKKESEIIQQGLAPLAALSSSSITTQKANLLETVKLKNWKTKAGILFNELNKSNIKFLVLKGFAFTYLLYERSNLRPYSDIDIIIEKNNYGGVLKILTNLGYKQFQSRQGEFVSFQNSFYDDYSPQTIIDLHWQINNSIEFHKHFNFDSIYQNSIDIKAASFNFKTMGLVDSFILGCFHYHAHRSNDRKHIWLYDLGLIWNKMNKKEKTDCIIKSNQTKQSSIVFTTLKILSKTFASCFTIDYVFDYSTQEKTEPYLHERKRKYVDIKTKLKHINGFTNKLKFLSEYAFQSRKYVKNRFNLKSNTWVLLYYPKMWVEDLFKLFKK